jgi:hypothetical protein
MVVQKRLAGTTQVDILFVQSLTRYHPGRLLAGTISAGIGQIGKRFRVIDVRNSATGRELMNGGELGC